MLYAKNKDAYQPAHPRCLFSVFDFRSFSRSQTLPYNVNGRPTENKIFNPFVSVLSVSHSAMSVSHSANALLIKRGPFSPAEGFVHVENLERTPPEKGARWMYGSHALACVLFGTRALLVLYLSSSHPLMSGGLEPRPDHYLTCNGPTRGVPDTDRMFSGQLLKRSAWKLTNNGCETVVRGTNLMTNTWQNFHLHRF